MAGLRFDRDPRKDRVNQRKHGVSFEEARTVFLDEDETIRIISARKATRSERAQYVRRWDR